MVGWTDIGEGLLNIGSLGLYSVKKDLDEQKLAAAQQKSFDLNDTVAKTLIADGMAQGMTQEQASLYAYNQIQGGKSQFNPISQTFTPFQPLGLGGGAPQIPMAMQGASVGPLANMQPPTQNPSVTNLPPIMGGQPNSAYNAPSMPERITRLASRFQGQPVPDAPPVTTPRIDASGMEMELPPRNVNNLSGAEIAEWDVDNAPAPAPTSPPAQPAPVASPVSNRVRQLEIERAQKTRERGTGRADIIDDELKAIDAELSFLRSKQAANTFTAPQLRADYKSRVEPIETLYDKLEASYGLAKQGDGIADANLIKLGVQINDDRASVVTDQEFGQIQQSGGVAERFGQQFEGYRSGQKLTPAQRQSILNVIENKVAGKENSLNRINDSFDALGQANGIDFKPIRADFALPTVAEIKAKAAESKGVSKTLMFDANGRRVQ